MKTSYDNSCNITAILLALAGALCPTASLRAQEASTPEEFKKMKSVLSASKASLE